LTNTQLAKLDLINAIVFMLIYVSDSLLTLFSLG
jgi:hypothetical protein